MASLGGMDPKLQSSGEKDSKKSNPNHKFMLNHLPFSSTSVLLSLSFL
jgi:hypothetical protein